MKRRALSAKFILFVMVFIALVLSACTTEVTATPTPLPTATATPRSTPLPPVPTAVPLASADNPLTILMKPQDTRRAATGAVDDLTELILELAGLKVEIELVDSYGEIVAQLCSASPVVGWVDGLAYTVAEARGCAEPALSVERDRGTGYRVDMLMAADRVGDEVSEEDIARLDGRTLCRISSEDTVSWMLPSLMLYATGINPLYDLDEVIDVEDYDAIIAGIYAGDCDAGAVPFDYLDDSINDELQAIEDLTEQVVVVATSPVVPFNILVYPPTVPLNVRIPLSDVFVQLAASDEHAELLAAILQQDDLVRVNQDDFEGFREFMVATGLDYTAFGE